MLAIAFLSSHMMEGFSPTVSRGQSWGIVSLKQPTGRGSPVPLLMAGQKALLDESTLWRINFRVQKGGKKDVNFFVRVRFYEDRGYEPPQGKIFVEDDPSGVVRVDSQGNSGIWTLSEDKDDRKDGLW